MPALDIFLNNQADFLKFLKSKFTLIHASNVFFRDLHYGVMAYVEEKESRKVKYIEAEKLTHDIIAALEQKGILKKIDNQSWILNYPEFALPKIAPAPKPAAAKPAAATPSAQPTPASGS